MLLISASSSSARNAVFPLPWLLIAICIPVSVWLPTVIDPGLPREPWEGHAAKWDPSETPGPPPDPVPASQGYHHAERHVSLG
jgi:hypothetical protein